MNNNDTRDGHLAGLVRALTFGILTALPLGGLILFFEITRPAELRLPQTVQPGQLFRAEVDPEKGSELRFLPSRLVVGDVAPNRRPDERDARLRAIRRVGGTMPRNLTKAHVAQFRTRLCDVAARLYFEMGHSNFNMRDLAARVGVSAMTPYRYFGDKDGILAAVRARGLARLADLPVSVRLIREIHAELLRGVRGSRLTPGELRRSQNWMGRLEARWRKPASCHRPPELACEYKSRLNVSIEINHAASPPCRRKSSWPSSAASRSSAPSEGISTRSLAR